MSRTASPGAYRNALAFKVSDETLAVIDELRGGMDRGEWVRSVIAEHVTRRQRARGVDWERRARAAEETLARVRRAVLYEPRQPAAPPAELMDLSPDDRALITSGAAVGPGDIRLPSGRVITGDDWERLGGRRPPPGAYADVSQLDDPAPRSDR